MGARVGKLVGTVRSFLERLRESRGAERCPDPVSTPSGAKASASDRKVGSKARRFMVAESEA